jgi:hypothetical protein
MKYRDWQARFWAEMERQRVAPFVWGERDCVLFAARMADAVSDACYAERAKTAFAWTNVKEAAALLNSATLKAMTENVLGTVIPRVKLKQGDIALVLDDKGRESLAIHDGVQVLGAVDPGVQVIPFRYVIGGWHVT